MEIASKIYRGKVRHRRFSPKHREFSHSVCYFYLDTAEIPGLFSRRGFFSWKPFSLFGFRRKAYLGPTDLPLDEAVRRKVEVDLGFRPEGPVRVLSQIAYLEFAFNPVSFYYCFDAGGENLTAIVAEITNTPWNERHAYVLDCRPEKNLGKRGENTFEFEKVFHVSPFLPMEMGYRWGFSPPGKKLSIHMENRNRGTGADVPFGGEGPVIFDATLTMDATAWSSAALIQGLLSQPFMTFKTLLWIYVHAALMWLRRFKVFTHPAKLLEASERNTE